MPSVSTDRVLAVVREALGALPAPRRLLAAVSGGPDSMSLLHALSRLRTDGDSLQAAYVDHGLRAEAADECRVVADFCASLGIPFMHRAVDTRGLMARERVSLETAARRLRYEALRSMSVEARPTYIALGHTADDQAETVLMHMLRGAGMRGLAGMETLAHDLFRPLLALWRDDVEAYCRELNVPFVHDASNDDLAHTRNRVRHVVLPLLDDTFPGARAALVRLATSAGRDADYLSALADEALDLMSGDRLDGPLWRALPESLQYHVIRRWLEHSPGPLNTGRIAEVAAALEKGASSVGAHGPALASRALAGDIPVRDGGALSSEPVPLSVPGVTALPGGAIHARLLQADARVRRSVLLAPMWQAYLDADVTETAVTVRKRRWGDRLRPLGAPGRRKLQDVLVDARVPERERDMVPVVEARASIVWVAGVSLAHEPRVTEGTSRVLHLTFLPHTTRDSQ